MNSYKIVINGAPGKRRQARHRKEEIGGTKKHEKKIFQIYSWETYRICDGNSYCLLIHGDWVSFRH